MKKTKETTIQTLATQLSNALVVAKRNDGKEFTKLKDRSPQWMTDVIREAHGESFPDDTIYQFISRAANVLADAEASADRDSLSDLIYEMEPDVMTGHLTAWLAERVDHVYYLSEAMEEMGGSAKDGFQLLALAQQKQLHEIAGALLEALAKRAGAGA